MIANLVRQKVTSSGVGAIVLGAAASASTTVGSTFSDGDKIFYSLIEGNNRETGQGTYNSGPNTITRDFIFEIVTDEAGYDNEPAAGIELTGSAEVTVSPSVQALTTHLPSWKRIFSQAPGIHDAYPTQAGFSNLLGGVRVPAFADGVTESLPILFPMNHDISANTEVFFGIHWAPGNANAGNVRWGFEYHMAVPGTPFLATNIIYIGSTTNAQAEEYIYQEFAESIVVPSPDAIIAGRLFRDGPHANDSYAGTAQLLHMSGVYKASRLGTPQKNGNYYNW